MADLPSSSSLSGDGTIVRLLVRTASGRVAHHHLDAPSDETHHLGGTLRFPFPWAGASSLGVPKESHSQS